MTMKSANNRHELNEVKPGRKQSIVCLLFSIVEQDQIDARGNVHRLKKLRWTKCKPPIMHANNHVRVVLWWACKGRLAPTQNVHHYPVNHHISVDLPASDTNRHSWHFVLHHNKQLVYIQTQFEIELLQSSQFKPASMPKFLFSSRSFRVRSSVSPEVIMAKGILRVESLLAARARIRNEKSDLKKHEPLYSPRLWRERMHRM